jgi:hypothetical protein
MTSGPAAGDTTMPGPANPTHETPENKTLNDRLTENRRPAHQTHAYRTKNPPQEE